MTPPLALDRDVAYRAVQGRDPRFDGRLFVAVLSTGIYCRPSCPSRTPLPENCRFHTTAAACVAAGFRACRRCRPDALPGSREWDLDGDLVGRALRRIGDGTVDRDGVAGLAAALHVSERHLHRVVVARVGATPGQLARTRRAQVARLLVEQTTWPMADVAFAAGFASVRQFNDVMRAEFGAPPSTLRPSRRPAGRGATAGNAAGTGAVTLRLRHAGPYDGEAFLAHVAARAVPGLERVVDGAVERVVPARGGAAVVRVRPGERDLLATLTVPDIADLPRLVGRLRHWADLDAEPLRVRAVLEEDPLLAPLVARRPGLRVPGTVDPAELVLRTVLGQQVSVAAARTLAGRLVAAAGRPAGEGPDALVAFPDPADVVRLGVDGVRALGLTGARAATLVAVAQVLADGLDVGPGADRALARGALLAVPGIGPWTAE